MATDPVPAPASGVSIIRAWWFRFLVRTALVLLAFWALSFAADRYHVFLRDGTANLRFDASLWFAWIGATVAGGLLFGLATWLPFAKIRYLPSRLLLAAVAIVPLAHFWWIYLEEHTGRNYWSDEPGIQFVLAALAGVAIASGFRAKD